MSYLDKAIEIVWGHRFRFANEKQLQDGLARAFAEGGMPPFVREYHLGPGDIADFLFYRDKAAYEGDTPPLPGLLVEVKVDGPLAALTRQIHRYAGYDSVASILVVTNRSRLANLPDVLRGKPLRAVVLNGALA